MHAWRWSKWARVYWEFANTYCCTYIDPVGHVQFFLLIKCLQFSRYFPIQNRFPTYNEDYTKDWLTNTMDIVIIQWLTIIDIYGTFTNKNYINVLGFFFFTKLWFHQYSWALIFEDYMIISFTGKQIRGQWSYQ